MPSVSHVSSAPAAAPLLFVLIARIPPAGIADFCAYEARVLPLLKAHGAQLRSRLKTQDNTTEVHIIEFPSRDAYESYLSEPLRAQHGHLLRDAGAVMELLSVEEVR